MARISVFYNHILEGAKQDKISLEKALEAVREMGVEYIEISTGEIYDTGIPVLKEHLDLFGFKISTIYSFFDFGELSEVDSSGFDICAVEEVFKTLDAAKILGALQILAVPGFYGAKDSCEERELKAKRMKLSLNAFAEKTEEIGVKLVMEDFDNALSPFSTAKGIRSFLDAVPKLGFCFDSGNFIFSGEDAREAYPLLKDRLTHVHLKDRSFSEPAQGGDSLLTADGKILYPSPVGHGDIDMNGILSDLKSDGYDGIYAIEHFGSTSQLEYIKLSSDWIKSKI